MEEIAEKLGAKFPLRLPKTVVCDDYEEMSRWIANQLVDVVNDKPEALICVTADMRAVRTYEILKEMADTQKVSFDKAHFISLYEWIDAGSETNGCNAFLEQYLYQPLNIHKSQVISFKKHTDDIEEMCKRTDEVIRQKGGIDFLLMEVGDRGEIGLNLPGEDFDCYTKLVKINWDGQAEKSGITLGIRHLFDSKKVILYASGKDKADMISEIFLSRPKEELPATVIKLLSGAVAVFDQEAASKVRDMI
jgi:6-phosphogluconolactonase/glucosamine-6-phosphate isomerase/deaminase